MRANAPGTGIADRPPARAQPQGRAQLRLEARSGGRASGLGRAGSPFPLPCVAVPWARPALW